MIDALIYIHSKDIAHRDLKCANILINNDASIRISDFGASKKLVMKKDSSGYEQWKSLKGSPYWLAPEVAQREGHDLAVDIWSLGCCAIEMLTGIPPWSDRSKKAAKVLSFLKNPKEKITVPQNFSQEWQDFIFNWWLQRDPSKRWKASELIHHPYLKHSPESEEIHRNSLDWKEKVTEEKQKVVDPNEIELKIIQPNNTDSNQKEKIENEEKEDEKCSAAVPLPSIDAENSKCVADSGNNNQDQDDGPYKTSNFSRWSDTQFEDGTCSLSFLKLWKTEEEKIKMKELERAKLLNRLKIEMNLSKQIKDEEEVCENPFVVSKQEEIPQVS